MIGLHKDSCKVTWEEKRKNIYLFELDSVRKSSSEIIAGQKAMFEEIVGRGNCVIITYNQLTDSKAFLQALEYEESYNSILHLFKSGVIKVSRYIDRDPNSEHQEFRTASQYILNALPTDSGNKKTDTEKFIFSAIPVKPSNTAMLSIIRDAIKYSDPSRISDLYECCSDDNAVINELKISEIKYIYRYVKLILELSKEPLAHIKSKPLENEEMWQKLKAPLPKIINTKKDELHELVTEKELLENAIVLLKNLNADKPSTRRSPFISKLQETDTDESLYAQCIVNLCYNYTVEDSILDVDKDYELDSENFVKDFASRLNILWQNQKAQISKPNVPEISIKDLPDWKLATRIIDETNKVKTIRIRHSETTQELWSRLTKNVLKKKIFSTMLYIPVFLIVEQTLGLLETLLTEPQGITLPSFYEILPTILSAIAVTFGFGLLSSLLSKWISLPDISDTIHNIWNGIKDLNALHSKKGRRYNKNEH